MLVYVRKPAWFFPFVVLFIFLVLSLPHCAFAEGTIDAQSHFFQTLYQWDPIQESEGVSRIIANASHTPTSGPFQDANLLAFVVRKRTLVVVDCANQEVILQKEFPEECILHGLRKGYVFSYVGEKSQTFALSVETQREKVFPGIMVLVTEGGFLVTRERDTLHIFDPETEECLFSELIPGAASVVALGDLVLVPTMDAQRNFNGYLGFAARSRTRFTLEHFGPGDRFHFPEYSGHTWESRHKFPGGYLPILREKQTTAFLELLDETGEIVKRFPPLDIVLPSRTPSPLHFFDAFSGKFLLAVEDVADNFHFFVVDTEGSLISLGTLAPRGRTLLYGAFCGDRMIAILENKGPDGTILHVFSAHGERLTEKTLWPPGVDPRRCRIVGGKELLVTRDHLVLRYTLPEGDLSGVYCFTEGHDPDGGVLIYQDKGLTFLSNLFAKEQGIEKPALVAFDVFGKSWPLPIELVSVSPHGENLYEVFEDVPTDLRFRTLLFLETLLSVSVEEISITRKEKGLSFEWLTPQLFESIPKTTTVTASLGPAQRTFRMTVVPLPNPLRLEVREYNEGNYLVVSWTLRNTSPVDIDDLHIDQETENLQLSHGDAFPEHITKNDVIHGKLFFERLFSGTQVQPQWSGYTIPVSGTLRVVSRRGTAEASFGSPVSVHPEYAFDIWIQQDPERPWWYLPADEILRYLQVFDSEGNNITENLVLEKRDDYVVRIKGVAPGFPDAPLRLRLSWQKTWRIFEFQPRIGGPQARVFAPALKGSWHISFSFPDASMQQVDRPSTFTPPSFALALPPNTPPQADFTLSEDEMDYFRIVAFDASPSHDPDGVIIKYEWWWPGSPIYTAREIGYAFPASQIIPVTLQVTDDRSQKTSITKEVAVDAQRTIDGRRVTIPPAFVRQNTTTYEVEVLTGDRRNAGTNARVFLALYEPREREGVVYGSGVRRLMHNNNPFQRGRRDTFSFAARKINDLGHIVLLHDNSGRQPGWYVTGVKVKDVFSGNEWIFVPNRWLALDKEDRKTYGEFTPIANPYPAGILVEGDRKSFNLMEVSDTVFILPEGCTQFYFTCLDGTKTMQVFRQDGAFLGGQDPSGGKRVPPYLPENEWGVAFDAANLTRPEQFLIEAWKGGKVKEQAVWVFPSAWAGYRNEALQAALLYSLKGKTDVFLCAEEASTRLSQLAALARTLDIDKDSTARGFLHVIDYGVSAFTIFGASPDGYIMNAMNEYIGSFLPIQKELLINIGCAVSVIPSVLDLLSNLYNATRWALQFGDLTNKLIAGEYKYILFQWLDANDTNLKQAVELFKKAKELVEEIITSLESNDVSRCVSSLSQLHTVVVGNHPYVANPAQHVIDYGQLGVEDKSALDANYPLALILSLELYSVKIWRKTGHTVYVGCPILLSIMPGKTQSEQEANLLKVNIQATKAALDIYEPMLHTMIQAGSILASVCLVQGK